MKINFFSALTLSVALFALTACNSKSEDKKNTPPSNPTAYKASYHALNGCSTGQQVFVGSSPEELGSAFCNALTDESLNKNCAVEQRRDIFKRMECPGQFPVRESSGVVMVLTSQYSFSVNDCGTGIHIFSAATEFSLKKALCLGLNDEELNRNCAKSKRQEKMAEEDCKEYIDLSAKPEQKSSQKNSQSAQVSEQKNETKSEQKAEISTQKSVLNSNPSYCGSGKNLICGIVNSYCLVTSSKDDVQLNAECVEADKECLDSSTCVLNDAKGRFSEDSDACFLISAKQVGQQIFVNCRPSF